MTARPTCPPWCATHEADHEGTLVHRSNGTAANAERYDAAPDTAAEDYVWVAIGSGAALTVAEAQAHVASVLAAIKTLTTGQVVTA